MAKPVIAIKINNRNYAGLVSLGNRVFASLTGNTSFATPVPSLTVLTAAVTDVQTAIGVWGQKGNRGSHADLVDLRNKALTLAHTLKSLAQYVQNTAQNTSGSDYSTMTALIATSGYQIANPKSPQGILQMVQDFHNFISRKLNANQVKFKFKKPLNTTSAGNVKAYKVMRGTTNVFSAATEIATTTKTSFIDTNTTGAVQTWTYFVVPVNSAGAGVATDGVTVTVPAA